MDEISNNKIFMLTYIEFLEFLARIVYNLDIPP